MKSLSLLRRFTRSSRGSTAVEFALISLVLVSMMVGTMHFGRTLLVQHELTNAAEKAVRQMLIDKSTSEAELIQIIGDAVQFADSDTINTQFGEVTENARTFRVIAISYPMSIDVPGVGALSFDVSVNRRVTL